MRRSTGSCLTVSKFASVFRELTGDKKVDLLMKLLRLNVHLPSVQTDVIAEVHDLLSLNEGTIKAVDNSAGLKPVLELAQDLNKVLRRVPAMEEQWKIAHSHGHLHLPPKILFLNLGRAKVKAIVIQTELAESDHLLNILPGEGLEALGVLLGILAVGLEL